jgi:hypothetical protein
VPTTLSLAEPAPVVLEGPTFPAAESDATTPRLPERFEVRATLRVPAGAALGPRRVGLLLRFQACDATSCQAPDEARLDLALRLEAADAPPRHPTLFP